MGLWDLARYCFDSVLGGLEHWLDGVLDGPMYLKMNGIGVQNDAWMDRKLMKMMAWRGRKSRKMVVWHGLGGSRGASWDLWCDFLEISAEVGAKMVTRWAKLAASCAQDGP